MTRVKDKVTLDASWSLIPGKVDGSVLSGVAHQISFWPYVLINRVIDQTRSELRDYGKDNRKMKPISHHMYAVPLARRIDRPIRGGVIDKIVSGSMPDIALAVATRVRDARSMALELVKLELVEWILEREAEQ